MAHILLLTPTGTGVGLTAVTTGLVRALETQGLKVKYFKPISPHSEDNNAISMNTVEHYLSENRLNDLLEMILNRFHQQKEDADFIIVQGLITTNAYHFSMELNCQISKALGAHVIFVSAPGNKPPELVGEEIELAARAYGGINNESCLGCIINKVLAPTDKNGNTRLDLSDVISTEDIDKTTKEYKRLRQFKKLPLLGIIPWQVSLFSPRVADVIDFIQADVTHAGDMETRRISHITICARTVPNMLKVLRPNTFIITAADRSDIIIAASMAALKGTKLAALLLTGDYPIDDKVMQFCQQAITDSGLPILTVKTNSFRTALLLQDLNMKVPQEDSERIEEAMQFAADHIDNSWVDQFQKTDQIRLLSPPAFRYQLIEQARSGNKRIVLPEGNEPRTIAAASICAKKDIAHCVLLGNEAEIHQIAKNNDIELSDGITIIEPEDCIGKYIEPMVTLRQHKALTSVMAKEQLQDNVVLGTMMLQTGDVDGLVSGAQHTTANTIRPALQLIKTADNAQLVSSLFFMCMPEQVLVFADCAVNPEPSAEELADIAIQTANSAIAFGIEPRIAMISYSTKDSGHGSEVDKVRKATELVKTMRSDLLIDGPLQYDAALIQDVAKSKAPNSPVAGQATIFIFPDLNTGNTTYKAVQRSADVLAIGPMLQGLAKPVNDLSRGATVDDIVYTIAITAIQAK